MTRKEAIINIQSNWLQRDREFCATSEEYAESARELEESLRALGCTEEELA